MFCIMCSREKDKRRGVGRYNNNIYWRRASAVCVYMCIEGGVMSECVFVRETGEIGGEYINGVLGGGGGGGAGSSV